MALDLQNISAKVNHLSTTLVEPELLKDKVYYIHASRVLYKLQSILDTNNITEHEVTIKFKDLLAEIWDVINSTMLSYTARPRCDLTELLCDVAEFVANKLNSKETPLAIINVLMPTVNTESTQDDKFAHLGVYQDHTGQGVLPKELPNIRDILNSCILGYKGLYLIPIASILESSQLKITANPYYDVVNINEDYVNHCQFLSTNELHRLANHSTLTRELFDAEERYLYTCTKSSDFYQNLIVLTQKLYFYSKAGIGNEQNAGSGVYASIIAFNDYYQSLNTSNVALIPKDVENAIKTLISLASDPTKNINATQTISTCIATNRNNILQAMQGKEKLLRSIGQDDAFHQQLITKTHDELIYAKKRLKMALSDKKIFFNTALKQETPDSTETVDSTINPGMRLTYEGTDDLPLTTELLYFNGIQFKINTKRDLDLFFTLSADEIKNILSLEEHLQQELISVVDNIEELVILALELPENTLYVLLDVLHDKIKYKFITTPFLLAVFLMSIPSSKYHVILSLLKINQSDLISTAQDFNNFMSRFSVEQCEVLFDCFTEHLCNIIENIKDLTLILNNLNFPQRNIIIENIKEKILNIVKTSSDFRSVSAYCSKEHLYTIFEDFKPRLSSIINSGYDYRIITLYLSGDQKKHVFNYFCDHLDDIIKYPEDFKAFISNLSEEQSLFILDRSKSILEKIINSDTSFAIIFKDLPSHIRYTTLSYLIDNLGNIINCADSFKLVLENLYTEERKIIFEKFKSDLPFFFNTPNDFSNIFEFLPDPQRIKAFNILRDKFKTKIANHEIRTRGNLIDMFRYLPGNTRLIALQDCRESLISLISNSHQLHNLFIMLSEQECEYIAEVFNHDFSSLFYAPDNFRNCLYELTPAKGKIFAECFVKGFRNAVLKSNHDLYVLLNQYIPEHFTGVFEGFKSKITQIITNANELNTVIYCTPENKRSEVLKALGSHLKLIFKTENDLSKIPKCLTAQQHQFILDQLALVSSETLNFNSRDLRWYTQITSNIIANEGIRSTQSHAIQR